MNIVERLRNYIRREDPMFYHGHVVWESADEIERLREALQKIVDFDQDFFGLDSMDGPCAAIARSALQQKDSE